MYDVNQCLRDLREAMAEKGLSVKAACRIAGISETSWYNWQRGEMPSLRMLNKLEAAIRAYLPPRKRKKKSLV